MDEKSAKLVLSQIEKVCKQYDLWYVVEEERKPDLRMIRVKEIFIKIDR
jgi:hypothetical protein